MAEATEARKAALEKARAARAAKKQASMNMAEEQDKPVIDGETPEYVIAREAKKDEKEIVKVLVEDEMVHFMIPFDPDLPRNAQFWENSINGHFLRFPRGVELVQPKYIADYVKNKVAIEEEMRYGTAEYRNGMGKKLNN